MTRYGAVSYQTKMYNTELINEDEAHTVKASCDSKTGEYNR